MGEIRLGTSGYSFEGWKGEVYPPTLRNRDMFPYYVDTFGLNTVEVNFTFYQYPSPRVFRYFARVAPPGFHVNVKLLADLTHKPWMSGGPKVVDRQLCEWFLEGIRPLTESGKFGCLLAQFPSCMRCCPEAWGYLLSLRDALASVPLVYEFRHRGWLCDGTVETLRREGIGLCAVDCPQIGPLLPLVPEVTSDIAYLRLHGRNPLWYEDRSQRYDYHYSTEELNDLIPVVLSMADRSRRVYVQFNNCHAGSALKNVKMMQYLLGLDSEGIPVQGVLF